MTKSHEEEDSTTWLNRVINELANPLDSMPIAKDYEPPRPEEDVADWFDDNKTKESSMKEEKSIHQKMYEIATAKYNPFAIGGSENIHDFDSLGGSENAQKGNN